MLCLKLTKKAQGLPLNVIIIAAIVLIVLVVLWAIFAGRMGKFSGGLNLEDLKSEAATENIGKTTCEKTCFATIGNTEGKWQIFRVRGYKQIQCTLSQKPVGTDFSDLDETNKVCCIIKEPTANSPDCIK